MNTNQTEQILKVYPDYICTFIELCLYPCSVDGCVRLSEGEKNMCSQAVESDVIKAQHVRLLFLQVYGQ